VKAGRVAAVARLDDLVARNLGCSKAEARRLIATREIWRPGAAAPLDPRARVEGDALPLAVVWQGQPCRLHDRIHLALNKPAGHVTALRDARHPTAYALLREAPLWPELRPAGRLDLDTTGLLLWTTDGKWLQRLTHPKRALPRTYQAALARPHDRAGPDLVLADGHRPVIADLSPLDQAKAHPSLARPPEASAYASITLTGGAYHEVRRIFAALGSHVLALCRVSFGQLALPPGLPAGGFFPVSEAEVEPEAW
jgi:16S rRNA pseudouridine516 synthase